jgi:hypothetical protein
MYDDKTTRPPLEDGLVERWWIPTELSKGNKTTIRFLIDTGASVVDVTGEFTPHRRTFDGCNAHLVVDLQYDSSSSSLAERQG